MHLANIKRINKKTYKIIKHIFINEIFSKKVPLLQKVRNKIPSCTFPIKTISSVFGEVKLALYGSENT